MRSLSNAKAVLLGGVLAGIGASACCVGPLLLLSLGISGAWISHLTAMEPYRPLFVLLTVAFLGLAFRKLYLVPTVCDAEGQCVADRTRGKQRMLFWIVLPFVFGLVASPWLISFFAR